MCAKMRRITERRRKPGPSDRMIAWTIYLTFAGAVVLLIFPGVAARWIALLTAVAGLILVIVAFVCTPVADLAHFMTIVSVPWVPPLGMNYHLAVDGVSLTMVLVTGISAVGTVLFSWDVDQRQREFFFWLLLVIGGCYGVFLSADLFLLFAFYELSSCRIYFLIAIFGSTNKEARRDEADPLLVLRRDVRFCRHSRRVRDGWFSGSESTGAIPL
jgi:NADH-quinone oxidoreductase subunit M